MPAESKSDIVVVGAGPAGTAAATLLAQEGLDVVVFEARALPRFHVGESLIPAANRVLDRLGVLGQVDALGSPRKCGVQFYSARGPGRPFYFSESCDPLMHRTWQVRRREFDALLAERAAEAGARIEMRTQVRDVVLDGDRVTGVEVLGADGVPQRVAARAVLDASGQRGLLARRFSVREHIEGLENTGVYAHYEGARLDTGIDAGSTLIFRISTESWLWFIPLPSSVSVGLVTPARTLPGFGRTPAAILDGAIAASAALAERLAAAVRTTPVRVARDFSYRANRDGGPGWALIGDALGFMDPVYSSGLYLSLYSAELAADRVIAGATEFAGYSADYQAAFDQFLVIVRAFYNEDFHFSSFARNGDHRRGLIDLFTGNTATPQAVEVAEAIRGLCHIES